MSTARKLSPEDIVSHLTGLEGWTQEGNSLTRTYKFKSYLAGIEFVGAIAQAAEAMNHHPDLAVGWRKVGVVLSTHSAGGITALDFDLARKMEAVFGAYA